MKPIREMLSEIWSMLKGLVDKFGEFTDKETLLSLAAEQGAKAGIDAYRKAHREALKEDSDRRLRNTELLLRNYRAFKASAENAIYRAEDCEDLGDIIRDLMTPGQNSSVTIKSIMRSAARTKTLMAHVDRNLNGYKEYCQKSGKRDLERRWRVLSGYYLIDDGLTIEELAEKEEYSVRQIFSDRKDAVADLSIYLFGFDAVSQLFL